MPYMFSLGPVVSFKQLKYSPKEKEGSVQLILILSKEIASDASLNLSHISNMNNNATGELF